MNQSHTNSQSAHYFVLPFFFDFYTVFFLLSAHMANVLNDIRDISSSKGDWRIKAQISRMWVVSSYKDPNLPYVIEMVLPDSNVCCH
jgi:hypothetical protein